MTLRPAYSPHRRAACFLEGFDGFVTSTAAPIATGWSDLCRVGIAPTEELHLFTTNEPIYERAVVKRGGADFVSRASRTSPSPSASVDLAHLRPVRGRVGRATRNTSSEPEAEGELPPSMPAVYEALADVT